MLSSDEVFEPDDEFVDSDLPNFHLHPTKFDENVLEPDAPVETDQTLAQPETAALSVHAAVPYYQYTLPDVIKNFITYFLRQIKEQNVYEIHSVYENSFNKLTERYFKSSPWPHVDNIRTLVDPERDAIFLILYKELYYRHIYSKLAPTVEHRFESWHNYRDLFDFLLNADSPAQVELNLPNQWLWDIIDEFIYQFQSFSQYRSKLKNKSQDELSLLKAHPEVWNVRSVIAYLQALISKSKIISTLDREKQGEHVEDGQDFSAHPVFKMLGYFSIIGLLRVHCLLGDYYLGLKSLEPIDLNKKGLYTRVTACHITLYYYMGFAYLMMRRYVDAIKSFSNILLYISRTKQYHTRSYQYEQILKKNEQMYALLAIAVSLCPQRIDENVHTVLRDKYSDKMVRMQRGDDAVFEELFSYACPKFIIAAAPNYDEDPPINYNQEALRLQLKLFQNEVRQQSLLPTIRSYLKLYSTISTSKLAGFLDVNEETLRTHLLCFKHKTRNLIGSGGSPLNGKWASSSDVDFYIDKDMIHIVDTKVTRRYGEFFIRHINKFEEIIHDISGR
jgi:translation initiation factor 3 subunit L